MLQRASLMTEGPHLCGNDWVFHQNNSTVHNACRTRSFFQENNITLLDRPACSPDLNPTLGMDGKGSLQKWTTIPDSRCPSCGRLPKKSLKYGAFNGAYTG
uniref:Tc1-like transposase DDE domain-containing protein n=1 Tax=Neolamprologus brichardi TaxID=32507 RepID=A0A3Q4HDY2_NEOBR